MLVVYYFIGFEGIPERFVPTWQTCCGGYLVEYIARQRKLFPIEHIVLMLQGRQRPRLLNTTLSLSDCGYRVPCTSTGRAPRALYNTFSSREYCIAVCYSKPRLLHHTPARWILSAFVLSCLKLDSAQDRHLRSISAFVETANTCQERTEGQSLSFNSSDAPFEQPVSDTSVVRCTTTTPACNEPLRHSITAVAQKHNHMMPVSRTISHCAT